jgi:hypothetical protein
MFLFDILAPGSGCQAALDSFPVGQGIRRRSNTSNALLLLKIAMLVKIKTLKNN